MRISILASLGSILALTLGPCSADEFIKAVSDDAYLWPMSGAVFDTIGFHMDNLGGDMSDLSGQVRFESAGMTLEQASMPGVLIRDIGQPMVTRLSLAKGTTTSYSFPNTDGQSVDLYISASTCIQPSSAQSSNLSMDAYVSDLALRFVGKLQLSGQSADEASVKYNDTFKNGVFYSQFSLEESETAYIEIIAPNYDDNSWNGDWTVQILATPYQFDGTGDTLNMTIVDTDASSVLLATGALSDVTSSPPYSMYVYDDGNNSIRSLNGSYCAITSGSFAAQASNTSITSTILGNNTREILFAEGLESASNYQAYVVEANSTVSGAGVIHDVVAFTTKTNSTCQVIYGLDFCNEVSYSVPSNSSMSRDDLRNWYDDLTKGLYSAFNKSMQIVQCDVNADIRYTIMRTCDQCRASYKRWLCLSLIPRCYESSSISAGLDDSGLSAVSGLAYRTPGTSRNSFLNDELKPDDYMELMPCSYTCHKVMQDCPCDLQFTCPLPQKGLFNVYGLLDDTMHNGANFELDTARCNFLGTVDAFSAAIPSPGGINLKLTVAIVSAMTFFLMR
ncbi:stretch-activated Ca2+-permeable channel component-domain-containing protein [Lipomyces orientalis]|uniref:Stretch-activated Ca2+-permeable channel component-domain-containing protein n=1 Tax=Lipomyces orientalis TaxID=1233043 RepID=A0ACC3TLA0_9ASCO